MTYVQANYPKDPWKVMKISKVKFIIRSREPRFLTRPTEDEANGLCDELNAQERVRDAAHDLLAACQAASEFLATGKYSDSRVTDKLAAAIAKATTP